MQSAESYVTLIGGMQILVGHMTYKPGIQANLDSPPDIAAHLAKSFGASNVRHSHKTTTVSDRPARRVSLHAAIDGRSQLRVEGLLIVEKEEFWQVQIGFLDGQPLGEKEAARILDSVRIAR